MEEKREAGDAKRDADLKKVADDKAKAYLIEAKAKDKEAEDAAKKQAEEMKKNVRKEGGDAKTSLAQKEPEDFSADEKQAAAAAIANARAAETVKSENQLEDDITNKEHDKIDFIDNFRKHSSEAVGKVIEKQEKKWEDARTKRADEAKKRMDAAIATAREEDIASA